MKIARLILWIYIVAIFSITIYPYFSIFGALGDIFLVIALYFVGQKQIKAGVVWAIFGGMFLDFANVGFPSNLFIAPVIILLTNFLLARFFDTSNIYIYTFSCFLASLFYNSAFILFYRLDFKTGLLALILNAFYSFVLAWIIAGIFQAFKVKKPMVQFSQYTK